MRPADRPRIERAYVAARDSTRARSFLTAVVIFIVFSCVVAVLWVGSHDVLSGQITAGQLGQFLLYAAPAAGALSELSQVWGDVSAASGAAERLVEILRLKPAIAAPASPRAFADAFARRRLFWRCAVCHPTRPETEVVDGISFAVKAGEKVAIVGPSGAGKSTLFHLLLRFYDPGSGTISLDGVAIRDADPRDVRGGIALVPQEHFRHQCTREHPVRTARRQRRRSRKRRRPRPRHRIHRSAAGRIRNRAWRTWRSPALRPASAHRDRKSDPARCSAIAAG